MDYRALVQKLGDRTNQNTQTSELILEHRTGHPTILVKGTIISMYVFEWTKWQFLIYIFKDIVKLLFVGTAGYLMSTLVSTDYYLLNILIKGMLAVIIGTILLVCMSIGNPYLMSIVKTIYKK